MLLILRNQVKFHCDYFEKYRKDGLFVNANISVIIKNEICIIWLAFCVDLITSFIVESSSCCCIRKVSLFNYKNLLD